VIVEVNLHGVPAVHVGVGLDRSHQVGHAAGGLLQLGGEALRREGGGDPAEGGVGRRAGRARDAVEPVLRDAGAGQRLGKAPGLGDAESFEAFQQLLLGVGGVQGVELRTGGGAVDRLLPEGEQRLGVGALQAGLDEAAHGGADDVERLGELRGGALGRSGGVVELVGEPGRHRAQGGEPLALLLDGGDPRDHGPDHVHDALEDRRLGERQAPEIVALDDRKPAGRHGHDAGAERGVGEHGDRAHPGGRVVAARGLGAIAGDEQRLGGALQQQDGGDLAALVGDDVPGRGLARLRDPGPLGELVVGEIVEQVDRPEVVDGHAATRY
jgi:hypothetical protein